MKIMELQIEKFRGIKTEPLTFDSQFTVITGANRAGKSSTLDAAAIVLSGVRSQSSRSSRFPAASKFQNRRRTLLARALVNLNEETFTYLVKNGVVKEEKSSSDAAMKKRNSNQTLVLHYSTDRDLYLSKEPKKLETKRTVTSKVSKATKEAVQLFSPLFDPFDLIEKFNYKSDQPDSSALSFGESNLLALVSDIASRIARANRKLDDPVGEGKAVVLIDELEMHLHPKLQRNVVEYLIKTFPNIQFITTTNSPFIIQSLKEGQLINLESDGYDHLYADRSIEDIAENVMGIPMPQKSERYQKMMQAAEKYYRLLREAEKWYSPVRLRGNSALEKRKEDLKRELDELLVPFSDNPAYVALLEFLREIRIGGGENAPSE